MKEEHRWAYPLAMLRAEGRRRAGKELTERDESRLASWLDMLKKNGSVVHYDPDTEEGFSYVSRQAGDNDMIRRLDTKTTPRPNADKR
ncbi:MULTISPECIES: hypothetical protein [unclassified Streptomyces]|uniref:hypothetical protein n=1 Tax=unclassified Streptomyces TaxID=2593676 RepID=UPI0018FE835E|nr:MULTISPECIES: hypothetical protein [unclassified Streptomyces]